MTGSAKQSRLVLPRNGLLRRIAPRNDILQERKPVSPAIAVRLGKLFGDGAGIWTRMQGAYDTWHAERTEDVRHIPTIKAA
ncbi:MAG TPA: hypothetical protein VNZ48_08560 [Xanthobacteraceae bacterium]|jgi:plasmid maintenance system antidote protein VapI|nr:hypothetical protein [Xanthobacteraceae bacterium]